MLKTRLLTAVIILPVLLAALFGLPPIAWAIFLAVILLMAAYEWAQLIQLKPVRTIIFILGIAAIIVKLLLLPTVRTGQGWPSLVLLLICGISLVFWILIVPLWLRHRWQLKIQLLLIVVGWLVLVATWLALAQLQAQSAVLALLFMSIIWLADTAAYFTGRRFGRRKLAPEISPGKTWEGVIGALIAVILYSFILILSAVSLGYTGTLNITDIVIWVLFVIALTALSILGDLFESLLKRFRGVKDSGRFLPGHGGILDRIDSLTAALPAAALFAHYFLT